MWSRVQAGIKWESYNYFRPSWDASITITSYPSWRISYLATWVNYSSDYDRADLQTSSSLFPIGPPVELWLICGGSRLHNKLVSLWKPRQKWPNHTCNKVSSMLFFGNGLGSRLGFIHLWYKEWRDYHYRWRWPISFLNSIVGTGGWMRGWIRHMERYLQQTVAIVVNAALLFTVTTPRVTYIHWEMMSLRTWFPI